MAGILHHKSRSACGEIIHVRQILAELWFLTLRIFTYFRFSSQLLHSRMEFNESWQGCCTTSLEAHVGRIHVRQILAELWSITFRIFTHLSLSSQLLRNRCMGRRGSRNFRQGGGGGPTFRKNFDKQKKKKKKKKKATKGEREGFSIYSALVWSKSNLAIVIAFKIIFFHKMTSPVFSSHPKHI